MKTKQPAWWAAPFLAVWLAGCGHSGQALEPAIGGASTDEAAAQEELARHPELTEEAVYQSEAQIDATAGAAAAIDPLFFWRQILRVERAFEIAFADTDSAGRPVTAVVKVHKRLYGWFHVVAAGDAPEGSPTEGRDVRKPLHDHWVRRVLLKRVDPTGSDRRPWRIAAVSGVEITSRAAETRIASLRIQSGTLDTTVTDALAFWRLRRMLRFEPETEVVLTATTLRDDDDVFLYAGDRRFRFRNQGDGTYTATWGVRARAGVHHFGVNALSRGTLHDDEAPYDSQAWILPFVVAPTELAELAP